MRVSRCPSFLLALVWIVATACTAPQPQRIAVLSYNIHHGEGMDRKIDLERIAGVVRSVSPDLVALQEVDRKTGRSGGVDQAAELARLTGLTMGFGQTIEFDGGRYGNAVLSRLSIRDSKNHPLPFTEGREARAVLAVTIERPADGDRGSTFTFLATHFDHTVDATDRRAAARAIVNLVDAAPGVPMLLAGDLNALADSQTLRTLRERFRIAGGDRERPTVPVDKPVRQIDYVLFRPADRWRVVDVRVLEEPVASDHRPLLAVVELLPP